MPKSSVNASLSSYDDIFSTEESRQEEQREQVQQIPIGELFPFKNHPFKVLDDDSMSDTVESVKQYGVLSPLIARPRPKGGYEIISGHRRQHAAELAGLETLPVIVRQMDDDAAIILMVDSNLQREHILPSERAFAYKMKLDAMKNQGTRSDLTSTQVVSKLRSNEKLGAENNQSRETVRRFIRLTNLIPELLDMVDNKTVSFNPAVELSYLSPEQQQEVIRAMDDTQNFPSVSQAKRIKKLAQDGTFTTETVVAIIQKKRRGHLPKMGRVLGGIRLSVLRFFDDVLFLRKKSFYVFPSPNQFLHLVPCLTIVRVCFFLLFQKFSVFDAQVLSLWQLFQSGFIKSSFCGLMQRDFFPVGVQKALTIPGFAVGIIDRACPGIINDVRSQNSNLGHARFCCLD